MKEIKITGELTMQQEFGPWRSPNLYEEVHPKHVDPKTGMIPVKLYGTEYTPPQYESIPPISGLFRYKATPLSSIARSDIVPILVRSR